MPSVASAARAHQGHAGVVDRIGRRLEQSRAPPLPLRPVDAERPDTRRKPPADGQRDRRRNQRAVGVAHRQPDAANLGVEAAGPGHHDRRRRRASARASRDRWLRAVATLSGQSQSCVGHVRAARRHHPAPADSTSYLTSSTLGAYTRDCAARCTHPGAPLSSSRGQAPRICSPRRSPGSSTATWCASDGRRPRADGIAAVLANVLLFSAFALHHSVLAGAARKRVIRRIVPAELERSLYTWVASLLFLAVCAWWQPVPGVLYQLDGPVASRAWLHSGRHSAHHRASNALDVLDLAGVRAQSQRASGRRASGERAPAHDQRALRVRAPPALLLLGTLRLQHPDDDRHARRLCRHQHRLPDDRDSLGGAGPGRNLRQEYEEYRRKVRTRMIPWVY